MFELQTSTLPDSGHLESCGVSIEITAARPRQALASAKREASRWPNTGSDLRETAMRARCVRASKRIEGRAIASPSALESAQELFARLPVGAQEELNRLHNVARQARYKVVLRNAQGVAFDHRGNLEKSIGAARPASGNGLDAHERGGAFGGEDASPVKAAAVIDFGAHYRIRHSGSSAAAAPIFDADGAVIGTLDACSIDQAESVQTDALTRAIIQATARAIEERAFRDHHRKEWIVAVAPRDESRPAMLFAVDPAQNVLAADRHGRAMLASNAVKSRTSGKDPSFWALFERNPAPFRIGNRDDISTVLVPIGLPEAWSALVTPPESKSAPRCNTDLSLHVRPRLGGIASFPQLTCAPLARGGLSPGVLRRVREHIDANLEANVDLTDLAAIADLSRCHFARAFKQSVGGTPHRYLMHRRLEKAQELLGGTELSLAEIALATGFSDQSHFSRRFRDHLGTTPRAFRRAQR
ncbi:MAG TPA: helix-turn-helix domain-containing protein [Xanthobacteraceae bacterium]|nr:helix-turn-helix domain-containing protein [Xanthobacteraceae bacterium]